MSSGVTFNPNYDVPVTGTITTLNGVVALDLLQKEIQSVSILGTWAATLIFEGSNDGTNWFTIPAIDVSTNAIVFSTTANGNYLVPSGGMSQTRVRASLFTSGTVNVSNEGATEGHAQFVFQNNPLSLKATVRLEDAGGVATGTAANPFYTASVIDAGGVQGAISVSTTAVAVRVGGSNLALRKMLMFLNNGTATLYWGYTNAVTTATGTPIMRNQYVTGDWGPNTTIWLIAASGTHDVRVTEGA